MATTSPDNKNISSETSLGSRVNEKFAILRLGEKANGSSDPIVAMVRKRERGSPRDFHHVRENVG
ncbi:hypothetical protein TNCV_1716821 [Trichonephila clavipes]|nr:hypothetical protein TNCV_1716821 [Trichonephila clavipes]